MANYVTLKAAIDAVIKTNGNQEITGEVLNQALNAMVNSLGANYQFAGVATPNTNPGTPDQNVFYVAMQAGTYPNFNAIVLPDGLSVLKWNGSWSADILSYGTDGVYDISAAHNNTPYVDLAAALGTGGSNIPEQLRKGGMSVKFIQGTAQSSDNKYVQFRYMGTVITGTPNPFLDTANWQGVDSELVRGSHNLVEGGAVAPLLSSLYSLYGVSFTKDDTYLINIDGNNVQSTSLKANYSSFFAYLHKGDKVLYNNAFGQVTYAGLFKVNATFTEFTPINHATSGNRVYTVTEDGYYGINGKFTEERFYANVRALIEDINTLQTDVSNLQTNVSGIQGQITQQQSDIDSIENEIERNVTFDSTSNKIVAADGTISTLANYAIMLSSTPLKVGDKIIFNNGFTQLSFAGIFKSNEDLSSITVINTAKNTDRTYVVAEEGYYGINAKTTGSYSINGTAFTIMTRLQQNEQSITQLETNVGLLQTDVAGIHTDFDGYKPLLQNLSIKEESIKSLPSQWKYMNVLADDFSSQETYWINTTSWVFDTQNKCVYPTALGSISDCLKINKVYHADMRILRFDAVLYTDSVLGIVGQRVDNNGWGESFWTVDCQNGKLVAYEDNASGPDLNTPYQEVNLGFSIVNGRKYHIEQEIRDYTFYLRIFDTISGQSAELSVLGWGAGQFRYNLGFCYVAGTAFKISNLSISILANPTLVLVGDSITEGYGMQSTSTEPGSNSLMYRYAEIVRNKVGKSIISAMGGDKIPTALMKFESEYNFIRPKYISLCIGTNGGLGANSEANFKRFIDKCLDIDAIPIVNLIGCDRDGDYISINEMLISLSQSTEYGGKFKFCRFDYANSVDNYPWVDAGHPTTVSGQTTRVNLSLTTDGTHPNYNGSVAMANRFLIDVPELFQSTEL